MLPNTGGQRRKIRAIPGVESRTGSFHNKKNQNRVGHAETGAAYGVARGNGGISYAQLLVIKKKKEENLRGQEEELLATEKSERVSSPGDDLGEEAASRPSVVKRAAAVMAETAV